MRLIDADKLKERINSDDVDEPLTIYGIEYYIDKASTVDPWHYPSKGELPIDSEEILCKLPYKGYAVGKYNTQFEYFDFGNFERTPINIECWQYIVPPKEYKK